MQDRRQLEHHQSGGRRSLCEPRASARAGQGRHVQRLRMGQLLPRPGHRGGQPPDRPPRHRHLRRHRRAPGFCRSTPPSSSPAAGSACRSTSAPTTLRSICSKASCRATKITLCSVEQRLAQALRGDDVRRGRGDDLDRALSQPRREEGLPRRLLGLLSRHRGRLRQGRRRDLWRLQPRGARSGAPHLGRQAQVPAVLHRLSQGQGSRDRHAHRRRPARKPDRRLRPRPDPGRGARSAPTSG